MYSLKWSCNSSPLAFRRLLKLARALVQLASVDSAGFGTDGAMGCSLFRRHAKRSVSSHAPSRITWAIAYSPSCDSDTCVFCMPYKLLFEMDTWGFPRVVCWIQRAGVGSSARCLPALLATDTCFHSSLCTGYSALYTASLTHHLPVCCQCLVHA